MHYLKMSDLADDTLFYYQVGDATGAYGLSEVRRFRSPPDVTGTANTMAIVLSDMGEFNWSRPTITRLQSMASRGAFDIILHNGDISYADNRLHINDGTQYMDDFNGFMTNISCLSSQTPYMLAVGNHEAYCAYIEYVVRAINQPWNASSRRAAALPGPPSGSLFYYSMDRGNVHWVILANEESSTMMGTIELTLLRHHCCHCCCCCWLSCCFF